MRDAIATAEVGDEQEREDPTVERARAARRRVPRPGGGRLPADGDDGEPDRAADPLRAGRRAPRRGDLARPPLRAGRARRLHRARDARAAGHRGPDRAGAAPRRRPPLPRDAHAPHARRLDREHPQLARAAASGRSPRSTPSSRPPASSTCASTSTAPGSSTPPTALGVPTAEIGRRVDVVTLCLSKGLGCPLGALLAGSAERMAAARRAKHLFGGAMRQAGIVAAAGALRARPQRRADRRRPRPRAAARREARSGRPRGRPRAGRDELRPDRRRPARAHDRRGARPARTRGRAALGHDPPGAPASAHPPRRRRRRDRPGCRADPARSRSPVAS